MTGGIRVNRNRAEIRRHQVASLFAQRMHGWLRVEVRVSDLGYVVRVADPDGGTSCDFPIDMSAQQIVRRFLLPPPPRGKARAPRQPLN
jgi:hypothetical protein